MDISYSNTLNWMQRHFTSIHNRNLGNNIQFGAGDKMRVSFLSSNQMFWTEQKKKSEMLYKTKIILC